MEKQEEKEEEEGLIGRTFVRLKQRINRNNFIGWRFPFVTDVRFLQVYFWKLFTVQSSPQETQTQVTKKSKCFLSLLHSKTTHVSRISKGIDADIIWKTIPDQGNGKGKGGNLARVSNNYCRYSPCLPLIRESENRRISEILKFAANCTWAK